jgi:hypothetical protein
MRAKAMDDRTITRIQAARQLLSVSLVSGLMGNLVYRSLIFMRSRRSRWRVGVAFRPIMIEDKDGLVVLSHLLVLGHDEVAIVEYQPISIEPRGDNGVVLFSAAVVQDDYPQVISGNACLLESDEFCDRVILAVARTLGESRERRAPDVLRPVES